MRANRTEYLFSVNTRTPPTMTVDSGEEFRVEVRGAFDDVEDIRVVPTPFTPACDGHPLAPITGPIEVRGAKPGDVVAIDLIELIPFGSGKSAILRDFGVLRREFPEPMALSSEVRDGRAWFGGRIPLPLNPNLGTISPEGYKPSYAGAYGVFGRCHYAADRRGLASDRRTSRCAGGATRRHSFSRPQAITERSHLPA